MTDLTEDERELLRLINADEPDQAILAHYRKAKAEASGKFYSYDPELGFEVHDTEADARSEAEATLEHYADQAPEGWHENVSDIEWGRMIPLGECVQINTREAKEGSGFDCMCDYTLKPLAPGVEKSHFATETTQSPPTEND